MNSFTHLHTHSYFSFLDGIASPEELILAARKAGMRALALTDHNGLYAAVEFFRLAKENNIKPIIGAELTLTDGFNLVLLVKNDTGYRNLCQLISIGRLRGGHLGFKLSLKDFSSLKSGLIALSGGQKGKIYHLLQQRQIDEAIREVRHLKDIFGEDFYLEMQHFSARDTLVNLRLRDLSVEQKVPLAATNDVHFIQSKDWYLRRIMHAIDENTSLEKITTAGSSEQHFKTGKQMQELFDAFPSALSNTQRIARACNFEFKLGKPIFPSIELPDGESSFSFLWKKCFDGATKRYQPLTSEVIKRLDSVKKEEQAECQAK